MDKDKEKDLARLNEIRDFVVKKFPDCCLAHNYDHYTFDKDYDLPVLAENLNDFFWTEYMNLCNCGMPYIAQEQIKKYLEIIKNVSDAKGNNSSEEMKAVFNVEYVYDAALLLFLAHVLDSYEFTSHGSSIGSAFITDLGRMYLDVLTIYLKEE